MRSVLLAHASAYHGDHPHRVSAWIANVSDHLIEVRDGVSRLIGVSSPIDVGISIAPCLDNGGERLARHTQRVDDDVIHGDLLELHRRKDAEHVSPNEEVCPGGGPESPCRLMPEVTWVERASLKVKHAVVFWNQVQITATTRHPRTSSASTRSGCGME